MLVIFIIYVGTNKNAPMNFSTLLVSKMTDAIFAQRKVHESSLLRFKMVKNNETLITQQQLKVHKAMILLLKSLSWKLKFEGLGVNFN